MPGPVSDSYDPEFGTGEQRDKIDDALETVYLRVTRILGNVEPIFIGDLIDLPLPSETTATLTEKDWRLLRFAVERARESL